MPDPGLDPNNPFAIAGETDVLPLPAVLRRARLATVASAGLGVVAAALAGLAAWASLPLVHDPDLVGVPFILGTLAVWMGMAAVYAGLSSLAFGLRNGLGMWIAFTFVVVGMAGFVTAPAAVLVLIALLDREVQDRYGVRLT